MKKTPVINKTAAYLVVWIGLLYDNELKNLIKRNSLLTTKFYAHDENNTCLEWDIVTIKETRPTSKLKRWDFVEKA